MKIAVLGMGLMGRAVAEGLLKAGNEVIVYNRTPGKAENVLALGAKKAIKPEDAIRQADAILLVLTDGGAVKAFLENESVIDSLRGKKLCNISTTKVGEIENLHDAVRSHGAQLAEVSIMVGPDEVRNQSGYFLLGCDDDATDFWKAIIGGLGMVDRVGETGAATKAETPIVFASVFSSVMISYVGATILKLNIPEEIVTKTVGAMMPGSEYLLPSIMKRNYDYVVASTESVLSVANAAKSAANQMGFPTAVFDTLEELYQKAIERGYAKKDASSVVEILMEK